MGPVLPIVGISPFERPDASVVAAVCAAGGTGVLDLGRDRAEWTRALASLRRRADRFGVRVGPGCDASDADLPAEVGVVVTGCDDLARFARPVLAQVTSEEEARRAIAAGAVGLVAKGSESGGRVGEETAFVLLQRLVGLGLPVWVQGGIGLHTAAACMAGGAAGVVIDAQLALVREASVSDDVAAALGAMDGSETAVVDGVRTLPRLGLPVGQEGAFAKGFAKRFHTVGGVVRALRAAMREHLRLAAAHSPLAPGSPLAVEMGTRYPIAQGPMSRVSDKAAFALAVARAGGMPFLALTLMSGDDVRALLRETKALLGDLPWGVGILGFVTPEVREAQLEVLREIPPPLALIAGGRPSQAAPLEAAGTPTWLHVPSPGLLDLFLADGARRFVFEGRECGGHVGPRSSFALWDAQIERLLQHPRPSELSVLFAGGIHDGRSAAMVAAMAAPLAAAGARIGVLMGTAYLFTDEAVASGAIEPGFQAAAIACDRTVLLETGPGHATRCADTPYAEVFAHEKRRLAQEPPQEAWATLERMNLGRLRIAAKGLRRDGERLVAVETDAQRAEGMYMIGQVAALRSERCTIDALHRQVSEGSVIVAPAEEAVRPMDVAIVGLAAMFPDAPDTDAFWANVVAGHDAIREVPPERWSVDTFYDPAATGASAGRKTPSKWGGFLQAAAFDPVAYGIPPKSLSSIEPVQLLSLEVARRALADAGYAERPFDRERAAVIFGAEAGTDLAGAYGFRALYPQVAGPLPAHLDAALPALTEDSFPGVLSNVIAGRIANRLDLGGPNFTVDAACAASLAAVDLAVKELASGSSDLVLCGGADLHNSIHDYLLFASVHALSPSGRCHTFDAKADGIALGEGVACLVLKRLADARRDGDRIYAVIRGVGGASDGRSLGLTAPRQEGQVRALDRAYRQAGVSPADVGLVEAHGTGTVVGDRTELATLTEVYERAGAAPGACVLGSVKSQIGHTKCAAGMAGLIKAALAIHHGVLPPTLHVDEPNPAWRADSPFAFLDRPRPWNETRRVAAVSAFGFGGTNFHVVLEGGGEASAPDAWPAELFLFRGDTADRVRRLLSERPAALPALRLRDLARSVALAGSGPVRLAIVAESVEDLRDKLSSAGRDVFEPGEGGPIAFLCPGQGSQRPGMFADLFAAFPRLRRFLDERLVDAMMPPKGDAAAQASALTDTRVAQPALGIADLAVADLLRSLGVEPAMAAGHSYGEVAALCVAGAIGERDLVPLSAARGEAIVAAAGDEPGTMLAVAAGADRVEPLVAGCGVVVANHNGPGQCVLSGPRAAIEAARARLDGIATRAIPVACAFHSPVVAGASEALADHLAGIAVSAPNVPVWSNTTAGEYPTEPQAIRALLARQIAEPVRWAPQIEAMYAAGARVFVEVGPGQVLTRLVGEILGDRPHTAVGTDGEPALRQVLRVLATLAVRGVAIDTAVLFADRDAVVMPLDPDPQDAGRAARMWWVDGGSARPAAALPAAPLPAAPPAVAFPSVASPVASAPAAPVAGQVAAGDRDAAVLEYLRGMRALVAAQRDVMLQYLGTAPAIGAAPVIRAAAPVIEVEPVPAAPADPMHVVLALVSERTGYPVDSLKPDLDLEADLGIDSIKRIEILGELSTRLGLGLRAGKDRDAVIEDLATRKTLRALVAFLEKRLAAASPASEVAPASEVTRAAAAIPDAADADVGRYVLALTPAPVEPILAELAGRRFALVDDGGGIAGDLATRLQAEGADVRVLADGQAVEAIDGLVDLGALSGRTTPAVFEGVRDAVVGGASLVIVATGNGGTFGRSATPALGGPAGLLKTVAVEHPDIRVRAVDLDPSDDRTRLVDQLHAEIKSNGHAVEVGYRDGVRSTLVVRRQALDATNRGVDLDQHGVVLVTGGARGITAKVAIGLARTFRCRIVLVGRSARPGPEDPGLAGASDDVALRRALLARDRTMAPATVEAQVARVLADREIRATLAAITAAGALVEYHAVDVRSESFAALIDEVYARHGRLDGVIHGAGVLNDSLLRNKTREGFEDVWATKVASAHTLARRLRADVRFVVLFGSVSGAFGNRGQADYAAANDALDKLAWSLRERVTGRVVAIDWGPWAGGMVAPALAREYARRGIELIAAERGVDALIDELRHGHRHDAQVILTAAQPDPVPHG